MTRVARLSDLVTLMRNGTTAEQNQDGVGFPVSRIETIADGIIDSRRVRHVHLDAQDLEKWRVQKGDILFSHINSEDHIGKSALYQGTPEVLVHGMNLLLLRANTAVITPEYLHFALRSVPARSHVRARCKRAVNQASINMQELGGMQVPVPIPEVQRRTVDLLSRAEGIVRLRRQAQQKAAELIPAIFVDMFGDPATNPKGWPKSTLGEQIFIPSTVRTPDLIEDADHFCIGADSIESGTGSFLYCPTVRDVVPKSGKYWYEPGEVLYSKIRPYLAKVALATTTGYCSADMYPLRCRTTIRPQFLLSLLLSKAFTDFATAESVRAQMPKLNRETLFGYSFPLPPIELQDRFSSLAEQCQSIQLQQSQAFQKATAAFGTLLHRAFAVEGVAAANRETEEAV